MFGLCPWEACSSLNGDGMGMDFSDRRHWEKRWGKKWDVIYERIIKKKKCQKENNKTFETFKIYKYKK